MTHKHKPKYRVVTTDEGKRIRWTVRKCTRCGYEIKHDSDFVTGTTPNERGEFGDEAFEYWHHMKCEAKNNLEEMGLFDYTEEDITEEIKWIVDPEGTRSECQVTGD